MLPDLSRAGIHHELFKSGPANHLYWLKNHLLYYPNDGRFFKYKLKKTNWLARITRTRMARFGTRVWATVGTRLLTFELALPAIWSGVDVVRSVLHFVAVALTDVVRTSQTPATYSAARACKIKNKGASKTHWIIGIIVGSVTRLGDLFHFGQLFKVCGNNYFTHLPKLATF